MVLGMPRVLGLQGCTNDWEAVHKVDILGGIRVLGRNRSRTDKFDACNWCNVVRIGVPGVFGDSSTTGLPLNETTVADQVMNASNTSQKADADICKRTSKFAHHTLSSRRRATPLLSWYVARVNDVRVYV